MKLAAALPAEIQALTGGRNCIPVHRAFESADVEAKAQEAAKKYGLFADRTDAQRAALAEPSQGRGVARHCRDDSLHRDIAVRPRSTREAGDQHFRDRAP